MDQNTLVRAWRDPVFRSKLPLDLLRKLPEHPSGGSLHEDPEWDEQIGNLSMAEACMITLTGGCTSAGCSALVCSDPCGSWGCPKEATCNQKCTDAGACDGSKG